MDKKGAELSVNVVIIAILAILVLVVVAFIFTGGASKFTETVRNILNPVPKGNDIAFAVSECNTKCAIAKSQDNPATSDFCTKTVDYKNPVVDDPKSDDYIVKDKKCSEVPGVSCDVTCPE
tara:strand:+ start:473 stop:835 length:363 start_codon:yes stop_codon:yes gene_type:complete